MAQRQNAGSHFLSAKRMVQSPGMIDQSKSSDAPGYPQESLEHAVQVLACRQIVAFLALTLAFTAPLSCQQHGMMSLLDLHDHAAGHTSDSSCAFHDHQSTPGMALAAFAGITPSIPALALSLIETPLPDEAPSLLAQLDTAPPD